jgi:hypothetical protein
MNSNVNNLTQLPRETDPAQSPDLEKIAFTKVRVVMTNR